MPQCPGGGVPSSPFFYKNPQFLISTDRSKVVNWPVNSKIPFQALFTYTARDDKTHVKAFLCNSTLGNYRISTINDETVVDLAQKSVSQSDFSVKILICSFLCVFRSRTSRRVAT